MVERNSHLFSYVLALDDGFAPNVTGGRYCTLACCKPIIRSVAEEGDWVMGTLPNRHGKKRLGYIMRIDEILSFERYFKAHRFQHKKPPDDPEKGNPNGDRMGDNIYYKNKDGKFKWIENENHCNDKDMERDTGGDRWPKRNKVLISCHFWYFGDKALNDKNLEIPHKYESLIKKGPGHKRIKETQIVKEFVSWVSSTYRPGIHGEPIDRKTS